MQEFSPSGERILIHQKTREIWDSMKDHSSWEGWAKMMTHQEKKIQSNWGRWGKEKKKKKDTFHKKRKKKKKGVFS